MQWNRKTVAYLHFGKRVFAGLPTRSSNGKRDVFINLDFHRVSPKAGVAMGGE
jgi:hypothetical protein